MVAGIAKYENRYGTPVRRYAGMAYVFLGGGQARQEFESNAQGVYVKRAGSFSQTCSEFMSNARKYSNIILVFRSLNRTFAIKIKKVVCLHLFIL